MSAQEYENVYANCDHMPGSERTLRVGGTVICPTSDWSATLKPTEGNTGINQFILHLDLIVTPPPDGTVVKEVITPCDFKWHVTPPAYEYREVEFHRSDGDPPPRMDITHTE